LRQGGKGRFELAVAADAENLNSLRERQSGGLEVFYMSFRIPVRRIRQYSDVVRVWDELT
jgi:hypothetical protein